MITYAEKQAELAALVEMPISAMVKEYNDIQVFLERPGDQVKAFRDRATAERRLKSARVERAAVAAEDATPGRARLLNSGKAEDIRQEVLRDQEKAKAVAADRPPTVPRPPAPKSGDHPPVSGVPARNPTPDDKARITKLVATCPKREGTDSARRWGMYRNGGTVLGYITAVGDRRKALKDIQWDLDHGLIALD